MRRTILKNPSLPRLTQMNHERSLVPWIGLFHVKPLPGSDVLGPDGCGAFVTAVALADSEAFFVAYVDSALIEYELEIVEYEDTEEYQSRIARTSVSGYISRLVETLEPTGSRSGFSPFQVYPFDEEEAGVFGPS